MIPVTQQKWNDCIRTCIGSLLEIDVDSLPAPTNEEFDSIEAWQAYERRLEQALIEMNVQMLTTKFIDGAYPKGYAIANVWPSEQDHLSGKVGHAILVYDGKEVWNPNPGTRGTEWFTAFHTVLAPIDPARSFGFGAVRTKDVLATARALRSIPDLDLNEIIIKEQTIRVRVDGEPRVMTGEEAQAILEWAASEESLMREREGQLARALAAPPPSQKIVGGEAVAPKGNDINAAIRDAARAAS